MPSRRTTATPDLEGDTGEGSRDAPRSNDGEPSSGNAVAATAASTPRWRYHRAGELGRGGMGIVHAGFDPALGRAVALKRARASGEVAERRLQHEAQIMARLSHPAIAGILDVGVDDDGALVAVLDVRRGVSFARLCADPRTSTRARVRALLLAARAVAHAHSRGVLHRDLSPANVLVDDDGAVSVIDWGLAVDLSRDPPAGSAGTPGYVAPELHGAAARASTQSDVWSLGALLALVTARPPPALRAIRAKAQADDPADRYVDASAFADDLEAFVDDAPVAAHREHLAEAAARIARKHPRVVAGACAAAVLTSVVVVFSSLVAQRARDHADAETSARLLEAAEQALLDDDVVTAAAHARTALPLSRHPARARGVVQALARASVATPAAPRAQPCERGVAASAGERGPRLCRAGDHIWIDGVAVALAVRSAAPLATAVVATAESSGGGVDLHVFDRGSATAQVVPIGSGGQITTTVDRTRAVVRATESIWIVDDGEPARVSPRLRPCAFAARAVMPTSASVLVLCEDHTLVVVPWGDVSDDATSLRPLHLEIPPEHLRGLVTGALVDDERVVFGTTDGRLLLVDVRSRRLLRVLHGRPGIVDVLPSGRPSTVAVATHRDWRLVDVDTGSSLQVVDAGHEGAVVATAAGPWWSDARGTAPLLTAAALQPTLLRAAPPLWSMASPDVARHGYSAVLSNRRDGEQVVWAGDAGGQVEARALSTGAQVFRLSAPARVVKSIASSPSGRTIAVAAAGVDAVTLFHDSGERLTTPWPADGPRARHLAMLDDDTLLLSSWSSGPYVSRRVSPAAFGPLVLTPLLGEDSGRADIVDAAIAHEPTAAWLVLERNGQLTRIERGDGGALRARPLAMIAGADFVDAMGAGAVVVDGARGVIAVVDERGSVRSAQRTPLDDVDGDPVTAMAASPSGRDMLVGFRSGHVAMLRLDPRSPTVDVEVVWVVRAHGDRVGALSFCDDGRAACSAGWDGRLRVIDVGAAP